MMQYDLANVLSSDSDALQRRKNTFEIIRSLFRLQGAPILPACKTALEGYDRAATSRPPIYVRLSVIRRRS